MEVDVVRAYHFGPKFLVELEVVLPRDTLLFESHDLGMEVSVVFPYYFPKKYLCIDLITKLMHLMQHQTTF